MHQLAWITSCRQSGGNSAHSLVAGYLLDRPPEKVTAEDALGVAPDLFMLFNWGRMVPLDESRPYAVKASCLPGDEILQPYRKATGKVVYIVRDPRTLIPNIIRTGRVEPAERADKAKELIASLGAVSSALAVRGTWEAHVREWTSPARARAHFPNLEDVCVVRFEDLNSDPAEALRRIIGFLGVTGPVEEDRIQRTLREWTPQKIRGTAVATPLPGISAFQEPPPARPRGPRPASGPAPTLADLGEDVEAAYRQRLREDTEFAELVQRFGYA
jgi:sulfotransferase family protein